MDRPPLGKGGSLRPGPSGGPPGPQGLPSRLFSWILRSKHPPPKRLTRTGKGVSLSISPNPFPLWGRDPLSGRGMNPLKCIPGGKKGLAFLHPRGRSGPPPRVRFQKGPLSKIFWPGALDPHGRMKKGVDFKANPWGRAPTFGSSPFRGPLFCRGDTPRFSPRGVFYVASTSSLKGARGAYGLGKIDASPKNLLRA